MRSLWGIPKDADSTNEKVSVFVKIKNPVPGTEMRLPTYKDLLGQWVLMFKNEPRSSKLEFVDSKHVIRKTSTTALELDYVADFTKQPITIDFYINNNLINQSYILFNSKDDIRLENFDPGKRKDHFTAFGQNYGYKREKPL
ncbi:hypothetical protein HK413_09625 [Mucilaginibacter sp. S1162]|uniref:Uncharacterized protein n=1 Tax=Mucilaginibacter humi TaxID=2732510 RepID=A0ABX1W3Z2_9SPHI|nr:hypothetical protein [Mucilaginibacter humi]NNU34338.1 hypothetical protein [Mucilaginibacter humi]